MYNPFALDGKTILITGASSGIGRATAIECSKLGAICLITGRNEKRLQQTFDSLEGVGHCQIVADLNSANDISRLVSEIPTIDGFVNNAGVAMTKPISFIKSNDIDFVFQTNVYASILLTKELIRAKKLNKNSSVVMMSSIASLDCHIGNSLYGMSKSSIATFAQYCANELSGKHIRVNSVHPGMVETEMTAKSQFSDAELNYDRGRYPLKRYGKPEEIAWAIIYLLSDASKWVTGSQFIIDGGIHLV